MKCLLLSVCLSVTAPATLAADLYVPGDHATIQAAIVAASSGDTIHVAAGTWVEALDFLGKDVRVVATAGSGSTELRAPVNLGSAATFQGGEGPGAILEGFRVVENANSDFKPLITVTGASPTLIGLELSGMQAAAIKATDGDPTITKCSIHDGFTLSGGGIVLRRSDAMISLTSIHDLDQPGILSTQSSSPVVDRCAIYDCSQGFQASTDLLPTAGDTSHALITRSVFARNFWDAANGTAIHVSGSLSVTATDNLFIDHPVRVLTAGGESAITTDQVVFERNRIFTDFAWTDQLSLGNLGAVVLRDNIFALDPAASQNGAAFSLLSTQNATIESNSVSGFDHVSTIYGLGSWVYQGGLFAYQPGIFCFMGTGPDFAAATNLGGAGSSVLQISDPGFVDRAARDLHLGATSVCIDGAAVTGAVVDVDGDPRVAPVDYGADELQPASLWLSGTPLSGGAMRLVVQGPPGAYVFLGLASSLLPAPIPTLVGDLELGPGFTLVPLGSLGADGLMQLPFNAPTSTAPLLLYGQALVGFQLTRATEFLLGG